MKQSRRPRGTEAAPPSVQVREVEPFIVGEEKAGVVLDRSRTWLRNMRVASRKRVEQGLAPLGPRWLVIGSSIYYELEELRRWVRERAVPCGTTRFRGARHSETAQSDD